jgi:hypothetical protein
LQVKSHGWSGRHPNIDAQWSAYLEALMSQPAASPQNHTSIVGLLLRIFWLGIGNGILALEAVSIVVNRVRGFSIVDVVYGCCAIAMILARYIDIAFFHGDTSEGEPATLGDWKSYSIKLIAISAGLLISAHAVVRLLF